MANLNIIFGTFLLAFVQFTFLKHVNCADSTIYSSHFQIPKTFGQNLTAEIDKVLKENDLTYKAVIKEALQCSQIVYYESDILLNDIEDIIPVIDLLNDLTPDESPPVKITLSLCYINKTNGGFPMHRLHDLYYSLETNITVANKTKLLKSLVSITLNFVAFNIYDYSIFNFGDQFNSFQFVNNVRNFVSLYIGHPAIPVGIMYNENMRSSYLVKRHIPDADFLIFYIQFDFRNKFPLFLEQFSVQMKEVLRNVPSNATIIFKKNGLPMQDVQYLWKSDGMPDMYKYAVFKTPQYQNTSEKFVNKILKKSDQLLEYIILSWANMKNRDVIIGNPLQNLTTEIFPKQDMRFKLIIPFIKMDESRVNLSDVKIQFQKWTSSYELVLMDQRSWRTLARFKDDLKGNLPECNGVNLTQPPNPATTKVYIQFTKGIASQWSTLHAYMDHLVRSQSKISEMQIDTILFYDEDIKNSLEIQNFTMSIKQHYHIGCSIQYKSLFSAIYTSFGHTTKFLDDSFEKALESTLCAPILK